MNKLNKKIKNAKSWDDLSFQEVNTARGSAGSVGQFKHLVSDDQCPSCGRDFSEFGGCRWTDCPQNIEGEDE